MLPPKSLHNSSRSRLCEPTSALANIVLAELVGVGVLAAVERCPLGLVFEEAHGFDVLSVVSTASQESRWPSMRRALQEHDGCVLNPITKRASPTRVTSLKILKLGPDVERAHSHYLHQQ